MYVTRLALVVCLAIGVPLAAAEADLKTLLKGVETRYNRAKTLQVLFHETYTGQGRPRQSEAGALTLRKPGRMRWDYTTPAGKLFLSDGKEVYLYNPVLKRVEKMPLKESDDMRAPMAFLLGKLDFSKDFREFAMKPDGANILLTATAKTDKLPYEKVEMLITPAYEIKRLVVNGQDRSILTFEFDQEKMNPPVDDTRFKFQMPPGAIMIGADQSLGSSH